MSDAGHYEIQICEKIIGQATYWADAVWQVKDNIKAGQIAYVWGVWSDGVRWDLGKWEMDTLGNCIEVKI